ncbi:hypothetical protein [Deinococcus sp. UYEF24]
MADLNTALVRQFLSVPGAVRLGVGQGGSAYPSPMKATQPGQSLNFEDAKRFQGELDTPMGRYKNIGGGQRYLTGLNLMLLPAEASPVDLELRSGTDEGAFLF